MTPPTQHSEDEQVRQKMAALARHAAERLGLYSGAMREQDVQFRLAPAQGDPLVDVYDVEVQAQMDQGALFLRVTYHMTEQQWKAKLLRWTTNPAGIYYIKAFAPNDAASAWPRLSLYSTSGFNRGESVGHAVYIGRTVEATPRPVYHLYDRAAEEGADGRRRVTGNFVLEKRRLTLLPTSTAIHPLAESQQPGP